MDSARDRGDCGCQALAMRPASMDEGTAVIAPGGVLRTWRLVIRSARRDQFAAVPEFKVDDTVRTNALPTELPASLLAGRDLNP